MNAKDRRQITEAAYEAASSLTHLLDKLGDERRYSDCIGEDKSRLLVSGDTWLALSGLMSTIRTLFELLDKPQAADLYLHKFKLNEDRSAVEYYSLHSAAHAAFRAIWADMDALYPAAA